MEIITGYTGKPHVTSEQDRDVNIGVVGEGSYVLQTGMQLAAEVSSNNEIKIRDGVLMHQGCTASIKKNTYDSLIIINGSQGMKRIDLIVARYEKNQDNGIESLDLKVIQGTPAESTPTVPEYTEGDIQAGDYVADMPMYQVIIDGLNITEVKKVFEVATGIDAMKKEIAELNSKMELQRTMACTKVVQGTGQPYVILETFESVQKKEGLLTPKSTSDVVISCMNGDWDVRPIQVVSVMWQGPNCLAMFNGSLGSGELVRINYTITVSD